MSDVKISSQDGVVARLVGDCESARTGLMFLPAAKGVQGVPVLEGVTSQAQPLAFRYDESGVRSPRHYLVAGIADDELPESVDVNWTTGEDAPASDPPALGEIETVVVDSKTRGVLIREVGELRIKGASGTLGIRMGLETTDGVLWWEWVTPTCLWSGPICSSWRVGGYAPARIESDDEAVIRRFGYMHPEVHRHNWVYCEVHLLMFANGVVRIHARHVNNRFFDRGRDLKDVRAVIGFSTTDDTGVEGPDQWEAVRDTQLRIGQVTLNLEDAATLSGDEQPAQMRLIDKMLCWCPYAGIEVAGRPHNPAQDRTITKLVTADDRRIPRGVARTVRFVVGLGSAPPRIARYSLPPWYHAVCGNLWPDNALPVIGMTQSLMEAGAKWLCENMQKDCFDDGSVARSTRRQAGPDDPVEPGWEGETPFAMLRYYYLTGDGDVLQAALRDAYNVADVATDHTDMAVRMHGHRFGARSLPMQRVLGMVAGYLETGDPYLLETAQAVVDHAYWWDRSNWPRRSIGRDAAYVRGLLALSDISDHEHYIERAREALRRFSERQLEGGAFTDQGGTAGFHGNVNAIVKPWMNCIMSEAMLDLLERTDDSIVEAAALGIAEWLESVALRDDEGRVFWAYKYKHGDNEGLPWAPEQRFPLHARPRAMPYVFRVLMRAGMRTGDPRFTNLCLENLRIDSENRRMMDQTANKNVEQTSWFEAHLWNAHWNRTGLTLSPVPLPDGAEITGTILRPGGSVAIEAVRKGNILEVTLREPRDFEVHVKVGDRDVTIPPNQQTGQVQLDAR